MRRVYLSRGCLVGFIAFVGPASAQDLADWLEKLRSNDELTRLNAAYSPPRLKDVGRDPGKVLIPALKDPDPFIRRSIVSVLGEANPDNERSVSFLISALGDDDSGVRLEASLVLSKVGDQAIPNLLEALRGKATTDKVTGSSGASVETRKIGNEMQELAAWSLLRMGRPAVPALLNILRTGDDLQRAYAMKILTRMTASDPEICVMLAKSAHEMGPYVSAVLERGSRSTVKTLLTLSRSRNVAARNAANAALTSIHAQVFDAEGKRSPFLFFPKSRLGADVTGELKESLPMTFVSVLINRNESSVLRTIAGNELSRSAIIAAHDRQALIAVLSDRNQPHNVRESIMWLLSHRDSEPEEDRDKVRLLTRISREDDTAWDLREAAVRHLGSFSMGAARQALRDALISKTATPSVRDAAAKGLAGLGNAGAETLVTVFADDNWEARYWAARYLAKIDSGFPSRMAPFLNDKVNAVRFQAAAALKDTASLLDIFRTEPKDSVLRLNATKAIADLGPSGSKAAPTMLEAAEDQTESALLRAACAYAFGMVTTKDDWREAQLARLATGENNPQLLRTAALHHLAELRSLDPKTTRALMDLLPVNCFGNDRPSSNCLAMTALIGRAQDQPLARALLTTIAMDPNQPRDLHDAAFAALAAQRFVPVIELSKSLARFGYTGTGSGQIASALIRAGHAPELFSAFEATGWERLADFGSDISDESTVSTLLDLLGADDPHTSEGAARLLTYIRPIRIGVPSWDLSTKYQAAADSLCRVARDTSEPNIRRTTAISRLQRVFWAEPKAQELLLHLLTDPSENDAIRLFAAVAATRWSLHLTPNDIQTLIHIGSDKTLPDSIRRVLLELTARIGFYEPKNSGYDCAGLVVVIAGIDVSNNVRISASRALAGNADNCHLLSEANLEDLSSLMRDEPSVEVRSAVGDAIANLARNQAGAIPLLSSIMAEDADEHTRGAAARGLSRVYGIADFGDRTRPKARATYSKAILQEVVSHCVIALHDSSVENRKLAARVLSTLAISNPETAKALQDNLANDDPELRLESAKSLYQSGAGVAAPATQKIIGDYVLADLYHRTAIKVDRTLSLADLRLSDEPTRQDNQKSEDGFSEADLASLISNLPDDDRGSGGVNGLDSVHKGTETNDARLGGNRALGSNLAEFPSIPPNPSGKTTLNITRLGAADSHLGDAVMGLSEVLKRLGYGVGLYRFQEDGFAVVTQLERIHQGNLKSFSGANRWTTTERIKVWPDEPWLFLQELILAPPGDFRMFAFIITKQKNLLFQHSSLSEGELTALSREGGVQVDDLTSVKLRDYSCHVLVYHLRKDGKVSNVLDHDAPPKEHMAGAGMLARLGPI